MCNIGSKELKLKRLMLNDELDCDTGNSEENVRYGRLAAFEDIERSILKDMEDVDKKYSSWKLDRLVSHLKDRKLSTAGEKLDLVQRLRGHDRVGLAKGLKRAIEQHDSIKADLESRVGHPVNGIETLRIENKSRRRDTEIQMSYQPTHAPGPICDYNWKDSHWASRTERQLTEICTRREMPGHGPKAAMLKWLDTGKLEYEDLYTGSLEDMCRKRGLHARSGEKKVELVRKLREADEQGIGMEHSLV